MPNKHSVQINVMPDSLPGPQGILHCRRIRIRDRLLTALFGTSTQYLVLLPSGCVESVSVKELKPEEVTADEPKAANAN